MGLLDGLTASTFGTDETGHTVFFPNGVFGAGYVLDTPAREQRIRRFVTAYLVVGFVVACLGGSLAGRAGWPGLAALGLIIAALVGIYEVVVRMLVEGLGRSAARRSLLGIYRQQAHLIGRRAVVVLEAGSIAFVALGVVATIWSAEMPIRMVAFGLAAAFCGLGAVIFAFELRELGVSRLRVAGLDVVVASVVVLALLVFPAVARPPAPGREGTQALVQPNPSSALPSFMAGGYPHEDPALEDLMPQNAGGLQLWVWSVRGEHVLAVRGGDDGVFTAVLARLGRTTADLSLAVAGRSAPTDPPNWAFAYRIKGVSGSAVREAYLAINPLPSPCSPCETRIIDGRSVHVLGAGSGGSVAMEYAAPDAYFMVLAPKEATALDLLRQTAAEPTAFKGADSGFMISIPPSWIVVARQTVADPVAMTALKAQFPKCADGIAFLSTSVGQNSVELGAFRATTEKPQPAMQITVASASPNAEVQIDVERIVSYLRGVYHMAAGPTYRSATIAGRPGWEVRWTGWPVGQSGPGSDLLADFVSAGGKLYEITFSTVPGRMSVYADAFQKIVATFKLIPAT